MADSETTRSRRAGSGAWLQPSLQERGLRGYLRTLRERLWLIILAVLVTTGAAIAYVTTAEKVYEAEAGMLVTPVPPDAELLVSLALISRSADPLRDVQTAAQFVPTPEVASRVAEMVDAPETQSGTEPLLDQLAAEPIAESNVVAVTAQASDPQVAADLANAFVDATVAERTAQLWDRIDQQLAALQESIATNPDRAGSISRQVPKLELLRTAQDPTLQVATRAQPPDSAILPRPLLSIVGGVLAGLVLGIGGAFGYQVLDPRLRREEQLRASFRLPILARIPHQGKTRRRRQQPISPHLLSPGAAEAYRALRAMLATGRDVHGSPHSVLVTSASAAEGKTTTAINVATSLALAGNRVILIEGDLRKPEVGPALGVTSEYDVVNVVLGEATLEEALVTTNVIGPNLEILVGHDSGPWVAEVFSLASARALVAEAKQRADFVILDSAPLSEVADALPLAQAADQVLLVVKLGQTQLRSVTELGELLAQNGVEPAGFALIGVPAAVRAYHYAHGPPTTPENAAASRRISVAGDRPGSAPDSPQKRDRSSAAPVGDGADAG